jgi:ABC-type multidrug transport system ATPase subunit
VADELVKFDAVLKAFKGKTVIDALNMKIERGEVVALCGGNGAGKSTLLRMLAGISRPTGGTITVNKLDWQEDRRRYAKQLGYMPDDYRFSPGLTAMETMLFWARLKGLNKEHAAEALSLVGLSNTGSKSVTSFSKGMRQRVLFAQALLGKPPLLVMDEPTNGLDPYWMDTFVGLVRKAASGGQTVLFTTHQLQIAVALADRIIFLKEGRVMLDEGSADFHRTDGSSAIYDAVGNLFGLSGTHSSF